ncbi:MAG: lyase family protein, partial [Thermoplasmata archaeon]
MKYAKKSKNYFLQTDVFFQKTIIESVINIKKAAAIANHDLGNISDDIYTGIISAINEIEKNSKNLKIQVFQTGSGTGLNMIINELISDYAKKIKGVVVHPNDHVNKGQSSNDVIPSALRISIHLEINRKLIPSLKLFIDLIENNYKKYMNSLKPGRTHLRDALPVTLGQELYSYYEKFKIDLKNLEFLSEDILQIPIGGTAVGTGYLSSEEFSNKVIENLNNIYNVKF